MIVKEVQGLIGAQDWIRTSTSLRTLRPEHSASTNFATWAVGRTRLGANIEKENIAPAL